MPLKFIALLVIFWSVNCLPGMLFAQSAVATEKQPQFKTISVRGRVVWQAEALARQHGIKEVPEASQRALVLETSAGELHPLVEDVRGRAFRRDPRLRDIDVELLVRKYEGSPFIQVISVFERRKDGKFEIDYWCEICSIAMVELKDCECCQGPTELRKRKVSDVD